MQPSGVLAKQSACPSLTRQALDPIALLRGDCGKAGWLPSVLWFSHRVAGFSGIIDAGRCLICDLGPRAATVSRITPEILARLLDEHGSALVLYARQWCDVPEDMLQEALLQLVRVGVLPENPVGWMFQVVRNLALNASRSAQRRAQRESAAAGGREPWFAPAEDDRLDAAAATEALAGLPLEEREAIVARLWGGLSFEEIGRLLGTSSSSAHRSYHRGLTALRDKLGATWQTKSTRTRT